MQAKTVAKIIYEQLGASRFIAMTGAKNLLDHTDALSFRLPARTTKNKSNYVKISLNSNDLYDVQFSKIVKFELIAISNFSDIYMEKLVDLFETETGLAAHLF